MADRLELGKAPECAKPRLPRENLPSEKIGLTVDGQSRLNVEFLDAAVRGIDAEIESFLARGADITTKDNYSRTALHLIALNGNARVCALFIQEYAKIGRDVKEFIAAKSKCGRTALHRAAANGCFKACVLLVEEYAKTGGDVKEFIAATDNSGMTALQYAMQGKRTGIAHFLAEAMACALVGKEAGEQFVSLFKDCIKQ